jgi:hypothetical protein
MQRSRPHPLLLPTIVAQPEELLVLPNTAAARTVLLLGQCSHSAAAPVELLMQLSQLASHHCPAAAAQHCSHVHQDGAQAVRGSIEHQRGRDTRQLHWGSGVAGRSSKEELVQEKEECECTQHQGSS